MKRPKTQEQIKRDKQKALFKKIRDKNSLQIAQITVLHPPSKSDNESILKKWARI